MNEIKKLTAAFCHARIAICFVAMSLAALLSTASCARQNEDQGDQSKRTFNWKLVTSWPKNYPGLGTAPNKLAQWVDEMSAGRLRIKVYGAGELVPALEVFDAVSSGAADMGHSAAYYWKGKIPALQFFSAIPFGMTAYEMNAWMDRAGGLQIETELYAPYNIVPLPGGNTGVQMAGWFDREIKSLEDFRGLKMRVPGLAGEIFSRLGGTPVTLPGGELYTAMQTGVIDATEWVGPYNDQSFGLHEVANYYYYPGWHEPGSRLEFLVHSQALNELPRDLRTILVTAARAINQDVLDEYLLGNSRAMQVLVEQRGVAFRKLPDDVLLALRKASEEVIAEITSKDEQAYKVYASAQQFMKWSRRYMQISEQAFLNVREAPDGRKATKGD